MLRKEENSRKLVNVNIWGEGRGRRGVSEERSNTRTDILTTWCAWLGSTLEHIRMQHVPHRRTDTRSHGRTHTLGLLTYCSLVPFCTQLDIYESDGPLMYLNKKTCERVEQKLNAFPLIIHKHSRWIRWCFSHKMVLPIF